MILPNNKFIRFFIKKEHLPLDVKTPEVIKKVNNFFRLPGFLKNEVVFLFIVLTLFILIASYKLDEIPGLYEDEGLAALRAKISIKNENLEPGIINTNLTSGPYATIISVIFFLIMDVSVFSSRISGLLISTITLLFSYLFAKRLFNVDIAKISLVLQSFFPGFLIFSRFGSWQPTYFVLPVSMVLYFGLRWFETKKMKFLYMSALMLGFGMNLHIIFLYFILALMFSSTLLRIGFVRIKKGYIFLFFLIFLVSSFPYMGYHLGLALEEIRSPTLDPGHNILNYMFSYALVSRCDENNLDFVNNLNERLLSLDGLLSGDNGFGICGYDLRNLFFPLFFYLSLFFLIFVSIIKFRSLKGSFIVIIFIIIFLELCFTTSNFLQAHLLILFPLPFVMMAYAISKSIDIFKPMALILIMLIIFNLFVIVDYYSCLEKTGGNHAFSTEISNLVKYLENSDASDFVILEWGLLYNLPFLSDDLRLQVQNLIRIDILDNFGEEYMFGNNTLLVLPFWRIESEVGLEEEFINSVKSYGRSVQIERIFYSGYGKTIYKIYRVYTS